MARTIAAAMAALALAGSAALAQEPARLTAAEDHARLMGLLGIEELRPGRNGNDPKAPDAANYDEAKSNPYPDLPPLLVTNDGREVTSADMWWNVRRPEIVEALEREVYGRAPAVTPKVTWEVVSTREETLAGVSAVTRELVGHVDNSAYPAITVDIALTTTTPAHVGKPVPVILRFGFRPPPGSAAPLPRPGSSPPPGPNVKQEVLARGWAYAEIIPNTVQADTGDGLQSGIIGLLNKGRPRDLDDWGVLRAWAWGASRALDYFETVPELDSKRVALEGLSRYGKATLVAMAFEPRFALGFPGSSGEGGASLMRRDNGETVENLAATGEYHWMAGNFLKYAGPLGWNDLPVDAHSLIALAAPRPLFIGSGSPEAGDAWVDPRGMFMAEAAASPVYDLLGARGLGADRMPPVGEGAGLEGALAWRQHEGGHTSGPNWGAYLEFAARRFGE